MISPRVNGRENDDEAIRSGWQMGDSGKGLLAQVVDEPVFDGRVPNSPRAERQARTQRPVRLLLTGTYAWPGHTLSASVPFVLSYSEGLW